MQEREEYRTNACHNKNENKDNRKTINVMRGRSKLSFVLYKLHAYEDSRDGVF